MLLIENQEGNGADEPGEGIGPVDYLDIVGQGNSNCKQDVPDDALGSNHDDHGHHGVTGALDDKSNCAGECRQEE